jgi:hypothetical protein
MAVVSLCCEMEYSVIEQTQPPLKVDIALLVQILAKASELASFNSFSKTIRMVMSCAFLIFSLLLFSAVFFCAFVTRARPCVSLHV